MTTHEIQLDPRESVRITNADPAARLRIEALSRSEIVVESFLRDTPPDPDPEPAPEPGEVVFSDGFEGPFPGAWTQEPASPPMFEQGNTNTHGLPTPPEMGEYSLRMKLGNCVKPAGCFPAGGSALFSRVIDLKAGKYVLIAWLVAHDSGTFVLSVEHDNQSDNWEGTSGFNEDEWLPLHIPFEVEADGPVELAFYYTAPGAGEESGVKVSLVEVRTA